MRWLAGLLLAFLLLASSHAFAQIKTVAIGATSLTLPQMDGFKELYSKNPDFDRIVEQFVPQGNRLLAVYVSDADVAAMNSDPQAGLKKYMLVQTNAQELIVNSAADFNAVKEDFANQIGSGSWQDDKSVNEAVEGASSYLRNQFDQKAELKIGDTRYLGKIADSADALSVMMLTNYGVNTPEGAISYPVVAGLSVLKLKSHVVILFVYSNYGGAADIDYVSQNAKKFVARAIELNAVANVPAAVGAPEPEPAVPAMAAAPENVPENAPEADVGGAMAWATKVALLVALLAAAALLTPKLFRWLRRKDEAL